MSDDARSRRLYAIASAVIVAIGVWLRLKNAWTDLDALSRTTLPDDAFYDFAIARHLSLGHVASIDGVHATNGFHPLWVALLVPIYKLCGASSLRTPVHVALTLGALLDLASMLLLDRIARTLRMSSAARMILLLLFSWNAYALVNATCGLETPLALALLLTLYACSIDAFGFGRNAFAFGAVAGLAVLARTDTSIVAAVLLLTTSLRRSDRWRWLSRAAAAAALVVSPWLIWSYRTCGTVVQSSGVAMAMIHRKIMLIWGLERPTTTLKLQRIAASIEESALEVARFFGVGPLVLVMLIGACAALAFVARGTSRRLLFGQLRRLSPLCGALLLLFVAHAVVRMVFREWYTAPFVALLALLVAVFVDHALRRTPRRHLAAFAILSMLALALRREARAWREGELFVTADYRGMAPSPTIHEGHTDCGAVSYFTTRGITNLDGIVNQSALEALERGTMLDYVRKEGFNRIYVNEHLVSEVYFGAHFRQELVADEDDPRALRLVRNDAEKDGRIAIEGRTVDLGTLAGRDFLDDGWVWDTEPVSADFARSTGGASEVIVALPERLSSHASLDFELRAEATNGENVQPTDVYVNGVLARAIEVGKTPSWFSIPLSAAHEGRNHVRFVYRAARFQRLIASSAWWRTYGGARVRGIAARGLRLLHGDEGKLPPEGPTLGQAAGDRVLTRGFLPVEHDGANAGVWAIGSRAEVTFVARENDVARTLTIEAGPPPPSGDDVGQIVTVQLGERLMGTITLDPGPVATHTLELPARSLVDGDNHLVFTFARVRRDSTVALGRAAYFRTITLQ